MTKQEWISRKIQKLMDDGTAKDTQQAAAIAYSMYKRRMQKRRPQPTAEMQTDDEAWMADDYTLTDEDIAELDAAAPEPGDLPAGDAIPDPGEELEPGVIQEWKQLEALSDGRLRVEVREIHIHELRGSFPPVETYPSVDTELLTQGDPKPFYLVLPIAQSGKTSTNRLDYDEALVQSIAEQLQGLGGIRGHIPEDQSATAFPIEDVDWVGHRRVGATLFAKGYIPPGETREYIRRVKARNGKLSTSIFGDGIAGETSDGRRRLVEFTLQQVDLAPAKKASLQLGGDFEIVTEMSSTGETTMPVTKEELASMSPSDLYAMMSDEQCAGIAEMYARKNKKRMMAAEMASSADEASTRIAELEANELKDKRELETLRERVSEYERVEFEAGLAAIIDGQFAEWKNINETQRPALNALKTQLRNRTVAELAGKRDLTMAKAKADTVMESDDFRPIVEMTRQAFAGGAAIVGSKPKNVRESVAERAGELAKEWGV